MTESFDLTDLDDMSTFADTEVPESGDIPDGRFRAFVDKVEITRTKNDKRRLSWVLRIIGPTHIGRCLFTGHMLETPDNLKWLKRDLKTLGISLGSWSELPQRLNEFLDMVIEVQVKNKGEHCNAYFRKRIELADGTNPRDLIDAGQAEHANGSDVAALFDDEPPF
jgi:hypothetical protein